MPFLQLKGVQKSFGAVYALADGDIELFGGEAYGFVGENGAPRTFGVRIGVTF